MRYIILLILLILVSSGLGMIYGYHKGSLKGKIDGAEFIYKHIILP